MFSAIDFSENQEWRVERFCIRLKTPEDAKEFREAFEAGREFNRLVKEGANDEDLVWAEKIESDNEEG